MADIAIAAPIVGATKPKAEPHNQLCTAKVTGRTKAALQSEAWSLGLPMWKHLSNILTAHLTDSRKTLVS